MYRPTLADAKARSSGIERVLGLCADDPRFTDYVNMGLRTLLNRGRWWGTYERRVLCVSNGCLTWPRDVASIELTALCKSPIPIANQWYEFLGMSDGIRPNDCSCGGVMMYDRGMSATFSDLSGAKILRLYYTVASDIGKKVRLFAKDANGVVIRTIIDGVMQDGFELTLASPFVESAFTVTGAITLQKPKTDDLIRLFSVDTAGTQTALGIYQATETKPWYRRSFLDGLSHACCSSGCTDKQVNAIVKLEFIPVELDSDWLIIPNLDAIRYMIQSIKHREQDDAAKAVESEKAAIRELNHDLRTHTSDRVEINVSLFGRGTHAERNFARIR